MLDNLLHASIGTKLGLFALGILVYLTSWVLYTRCLHPLSKFPGPFLGSVTDWWYFVSARRPIPENTRYTLHRRYNSKVVRIRPNGVSVSDARAIDVVFGTKPSWEKTNFYGPFDPHIEGGREIFSLRDNAVHASLKRTVGPLWTVKAITGYEPRIDRTLAAFRRRMDRCAQSSETVSLPRLFNQYTLDVLGDIFYGKEGGFGGLENDVDHRKWTEMVTKMIAPLSVSGLAPRGMQTLYALSQIATNSKVRSGIGDHDGLIADAKAIVAQKVRERQSEKSDGATASSDRTSSDGDTRDMISKLLDLVGKDDNPLDRHKLHEADISAHTYTAIVSAPWLPNHVVLHRQQFLPSLVTDQCVLLQMAGFDTTGIALSHVFVCLFAHPRCLNKLQSEIKNALSEGTVSSTKPRYLDTVKLPYLNACIHETYRYSLGNLGFPRYVPTGGAILPDGTFLPGGTAVTMSPACTSMDESIYGTDVEDFRPERWLDAGEEKAKLMERYLLVFGAGSRVCMGKHLASMEIWKVVVTLLGSYDLDLVGKPSIRQEWFQRVDGLDVVVRKQN